MSEGAQGTSQGDDLGKGPPLAVVSIRAAYPISQSWSGLAHSAVATSGCFENQGGGNVGELT